MKYLIGTKQGMTELFREDGTVVAGTLISCPPNTVTQVKSAERDGYAATQVGAGKRTHGVGKVDAAKPFRMLAESRDLAGVEAGAELAVTQFEVGDQVAVSGTSKAKGFASVIKRHGFHGGPRSHGQKHSERAPGSLGAGGYQRVFKGRRMAGRTGGERVTVSGLKVLAILPEENQLLVSGAVPGRRGTWLVIRSARG